MTYDEILALLTANNIRTSGFLTVDELRSLVASASVDLPGGPGTVTLLYSGPLDSFGSQNATSLAQSIAANSGGRVRIVDGTDAARLLVDPEFRRALENSGLLPDEINGLIFGTSGTNGERISQGLFDDVSRRFIGATGGGEFMTLTPFARDTRVFAQTELGALLDDPRVTDINGVPRQTLVDFYGEQIARGLTPEAALAGGSIGVKSCL
jgi:hypothetical protein